jgi:hypothetical protein
MKISEYYSDDKLRYSMVLKRDDSFRVVVLDSYFETQDERFFDILEQAENYAEDFVLRK